MNSSNPNMEFSIIQPKKTAVLVDLSFFFLKDIILTRVLKQWRLKNWLRD